MLLYGYADVMYWICSDYIETKQLAFRSAYGRTAPFDDVTNQVSWPVYIEMAMVIPNLS